MINTTIEGSFSVEVIRDGKVRLSLPRAKYLITRGGMEDTQILGTILEVGTGGATPVFNDTSLENPLALIAGGSWTSSTSVLTGTDYVKESSSVFTFNIGDVVGNVAELGVKLGSTLQTRALFKDGSGDPTTIPVTATDQLIITYFVKKTISMIPVTSSMLATLDGVSTTIDFTIRPCIASSADSGSPAHYPASLYQQTSGANLYIQVNSNESNFATISGPDYIPVLVDSGYDRSDEGSSVVSLTATGNTVIHTMNTTLDQCNFKWTCATFQTFSSFDVINMMFQLEFNGPNYINKTSSDTVTFKIKETMNQVIS